MLISIVNRSTKITDAEVQCVIRAINRQIREDFEPYWSFGAHLRLEGKVGRAPSKRHLQELRGDAILYLWDKVDMADALGYHDRNASGIPYGFIFTELAAQLNEPWSVTLSHEALELIGDAEGNLLVQGPHPEDPNVEVFHWFEMCDAVQSQTYQIDGIAVANFLLPLYFTADEQKGGRNDFLGTLDAHGKALTSFGIAKGGYIGFYDPRSKQQVTYVKPDDARAAERRRIKADNAFGRGYLRANSQGSGPRESVHGRVLARQAGMTAATVPQPRAAQAAQAAADPIEHVVVLMMENRSFDHMLGGMRQVHADVEGVEPDGQAPHVNLRPDGNAIAQRPTARYVIDKKRDLNHEHQAVLEQIGTADAPMAGFVTSYCARYADASDAELEQVMSYFPFGKTPDDDTLPALHALARHFTVCDHWFSSMPGPTWQNRFFAHSGTCLGHLTMPSRDEPQNMHLYYQETIYDRLSDAGKTWRIYHHGMPQSIVMTRLLPSFITGKGYDGMEQFYSAAAGPANDFPHFSFIEPCYFGQEENDQHPPADARQGDALIGKVYEALRANPELWQSTLLIVTYDEHGGFYDHVPPPATIAPDEFVQEWQFDRLGVRVPAILVSPWVGKGVTKTVLEHTSVLRYLCDKWNLAPLGNRMKADAGALRTNSFAGELQQLQAARDDTPEHIAPPEIKAQKRNPVEPPIEGSREALLLYVNKLPEITPPSHPLKAAKGNGHAVDAALSYSAALDKLGRLQTTPMHVAPPPPKKRRRAAPRQAR